MSHDAPTPSTDPTPETEAEREPQPSGSSFFGADAEPSRLARWNPFARRPGRVRVAVLLLLLVAVVGGAAYAGYELLAPQGGPERSVTCWNGDSAGARRDCTAPTGEAGLAWVFPGMPGKRSCSPSTLRDRLPGARTSTTCRERLGSLTAEVTYSEVTDPGELRNDLDRAYGAGVRDETRSANGVPLLRWRPLRPVLGRWQAAAQVKGQPYAVGVVVAERRDLLPALREAAQVRRAPLSVRRR